MEISELAKNREINAKNTGDYYYKNNTADSLDRRKWFAKIVVLYKPKSILEIGCNEGANLRCMREVIPEIKLAGIDINKNAVNFARSTMPNANIVCGSIYDLDKYFKEKEFDLVFSMGVMIHLPPETINSVGDKAAKLAKNIVLHCEEHSENPEVKRRDRDIPHRWSHNYINIYNKYKVKIFKDVLDGSGGAHQLAVVYIGSNSMPKISILGKIRLWYLCSWLPFVYKWLKRIKIRCNVTLKI